MTTIRVETLIKYTDPLGNPVKIPLTATPSAAFTSVDRRDLTLTTATKQILWDPTTTPDTLLTAFDFVAIWSNGSAVDIEFQVDADNSTTFKDVSTMRLIDSLPLMLGADDSYVGSSTTDLFAAGTLDLIQRIAVQNNSGSTRTVTMIFGKV